MVRTLLVDNSPQVRAAAASAFDVLQKHIGPKAIDQTIPTLLSTLRQAGPGADTALQALKEVMTVSLIHRRQMSLNTITRSGHLRCSLPLFLL